MLLKIIIILVMLIVALLVFYLIKKNHKLKIPKLPEPSFQEVINFAVDNLMYYDYLSEL